MELTDTKTYLYPLTSATNSSMPAHNSVAHLKHLRTLSLPNRPKTAHKNRKNVLEITKMQERVLQINNACIKKSHHESRPKWCVAYSANGNVAL